MKWKTKDGRILDIKDMDDDHLMNAARLLLRKAASSYRETLLPYFSGQPNGDGAQMAYEAELDTLTEESLDLFLPEAYYAMYDEAMARNVDFAHELDSYCRRCELVAIAKTLAEENHSKSNC